MKLSVHQRFGINVEVLVTSTVQKSSPPEDDTLYQGQTYVFHRFLQGRCTKTINLPRGLLFDQVCNDYPKLLDSTRWRLSIVPNFDDRHCYRTVKHNVHSVQLKQTTKLVNNLGRLKYRYNFFFIFDCHY